ncbi:hypothetical protein [Micromonospora sp. SH-82]|uniref:hypothetical protein n=1 Tax=Micromonospora sp. SH-82 TaxID=3132938 RepID=UPI003EB6F960
MPVPNPDGAQGRTASADQKTVSAVAGMRPGSDPVVESEDLRRARIVAQARHGLVRVSHAMGDAVEHQDRLTYQALQADGRVVSLEDKHSAQTPKGPVAPPQGRQGGRGI